MTNVIRITSLLALVTAAATGCDTVSPPEIPGEIIPDEVEEALGTLPEPEASSVLDFLERENFRESWALFPGTEPRMPGADPHGTTLTTYVNETARDSIEAGEVPLAYDSILVKDNFSGEGNVVSTTMMFRSEGFNPEAGDWFWMKWQPDQTIDAAGMLGTCQNCHEMAPGESYVLTRYSPN